MIAGGIGMCIVMCVEDNMPSKVFIQDLAG